MLNFKGYVIFLTAFISTFFTDKDVTNYQTNYQLVNVDTVTLEEASLSSSLELIVDKHFIVLDKDQGNIFYFDKTGALDKKIARKGRGPGELLAPSSITLDSEKNLYVFDNSLMRINIYNSEGHYLKSIKAENRAIDMKVSGDNIFTYNPFKEKIVSKYEISDGKFINQFGSNSEVHNRLKTGLSSTFFRGINVNNDTIYTLSHPYDFSIQLFNLNGEFLGRKKPTSTIFRPAEIPLNFNPFTDVNKMSDYVSNSVLKFYTGKRYIYFLISNFSEDEKYLEIYDYEFAKINTSKIPTGHNALHEYDEEKFFYSLIRSETDEFSLKIIMSELNTQ